MAFSSIFIDPSIDAGSVTSVSVVTANGVSGSVANPTTTPAITLTLGAITPSSVAINGGTALTTSNQTGTGSVVLANTPTLITPVIGAATGTSLVLGAQIDAVTYKHAGALGIGAALTVTPADQTGITSTTPLMLGLGAATAATVITPSSTGRVVFTICGDIDSSGSATSTYIQLAYGSGTPPANSGPAAGTTISAQQQFIYSGAGNPGGFSVTGFVSGLTVGTAYWFDLQVKAAAGVATVIRVTGTAFEI
jgi:hypothetical protein